MNDQERYVAQLEDTLKKVLKPLKDIPFRVAIQAVSGRKLVAFDKKNSMDQRLLKDLVKAAKVAVVNVNRVGILSSRANEVGNKIEPFVTMALKEVGLSAGKPLTAGGKAKATGYPDIMVTDRDMRSSYLECKTYNKKNYQTTQRSFYFSPATTPGGFKVRVDARHFVISFEIETGNRNGKSVFIPVAWKIFSVDDLVGQIKHEFNATNRQMYTPAALLAEGTLKDETTELKQGRLE